MEIKIDIENYPSEEEIKEVCKDTMRGIIREQFRKEAIEDSVHSYIAEKLFNEKE